jgi:hypothetical protein
MMDDGWWMSIYIFNSLKTPHSVKFWWMDEKWCQHDIMVVVIWELHGSWKGVVVIELYYGVAIKLQ